MWLPGYSASILQVFITCEVFTIKVILHFWKQEKDRLCQVRNVWRMLKDVPMELLTQQACVCWAVCRHALLYNRTIPCESLPFQQDNLRSHWPAENGLAPLNQHNHDHSYLCTYHVTRSKVLLHEETFQHHSEHQKPMIGYNKTGAWTVCTKVLYFLDGLRIISVERQIAQPYTLRRYKAVRCSKDK